MIINKTCPMCKKEHEIEVNDFELYAYEAGKLLQDAFPDLNPMEREFIKTGYCPKCQTLLFGSEYESELIKRV